MAMEIDAPLTLPDANILSFISGTTNPRELVQNGFCEDFRNVVIRLCSEIQCLYGIKEGLPCGTDSSDPTFLYELSSFLAEIECPCEEITCGPIEERFASNERCLLLLTYLTNEIKAARLFASNKCSIPVVENTNASPVTPFLASALTCVHVPSSSSTSGVEILRHLNDAVLRQLEKCKKRPTALFKCNEMDSKKWMAIEKIVVALGQDCRSRNILLLKRIDVAISSFLWADKVRKNEKQIKDIFNRKRPQIADPTLPDIAALLGAEESLVTVDEVTLKTRRGTTTHLNPMVKEDPPDRGGRTNDMPALPKETFRYQAASRGQRGQGGGRGQGNRGSRGNNSNRGYRGGGSSYEQQVRNEYHDRSYGRSMQNQRGGGYNSGGGFVNQSGNFYQNESQAGFGDRDGYGNQFGQYRQQGGYNNRGGFRGRGNYR